MASITICNLDDDVKIRLRVRAAGNGRFMEEEARLIMREAVGRETAPEKGLGGRLSTSCSSRSAASNWSCRHASRCANRPFN